jgi:hypothetical protein
MRGKSMARSQQMVTFQKKTAGRACRFILPRILTVLLSSVDGLLQLRSGGELGHAAGGNFDGGSGLRIASVARLAL